MTDSLIYMASGSGRRFGSNKLLHSFEGKPLYLYGLTTLLQAAKRRRNCRILVVSRYEEIRRQALSLGAEAVDCPESALGASFTVKAGLRALPELQKGDRILFAAADQPFLSSQSGLRLLDTEIGENQTARLCFGSTPGNPVLFPAALSRELMTLTGDQGGGVVVKHHSCIFVPVIHPRELQDIDLLSDLKKL